MKLVSYREDGAVLAGVQVDGRVVPATEAAVGIIGTQEGWAATVLGIIQQDAATLDALAGAAGKLQGPPVGELDLAPPIPEPQKIICIGLNYRAHVEEAKEIAGAPNEASTVPILFPKFVTSLVGHEDDVVIPGDSKQMDWEAELAVVMGKTASRVSAANALDYVAGYSAFNDVSARDLQLQTPQWTAGKAADTLGPFGPVLVLKDEIPDPQALRLTAHLNGELMQESTTDLMIFPVARLIEFISSIITLVPGDVIATGTPAGIGIGRKPPVFMQPGDVIEVEVQGIGVLRNTIVEPT